MARLRGMWKALVTMEQRRQPAGIAWMVSAKKPFLFHVVCPVSARSSLAGNACQHGCTYPTVS